MESLKRVIANAEIINDRKALQQRQDG